MDPYINKINHIGVRGLATPLPAEAATNLVLTDAIPANTTYKPGTLRVSAGANAGAKTDAATPGEQTFGDNESKSCSCTVVGSTRSDSAPFAWVAFAGFMGLVAARRRR